MTWAIIKFGDRNTKCLKEKKKQENIDPIDNGMYLKLQGFPNLF